MAQNSARPVGTVQGSARQIGISHPSARPISAEQDSVSEANQDSTAQFLPIGTAQSTGWPVGDQHCIGLREEMLRGQSKGQDRGGKGQVGVDCSKAGATGSACAKRSACVSLCTNESNKQK